MPSCQLLSSIESAFIAYSESGGSPYKIAVLEGHELLSTHVLVYVLVVCHDALAVYSAL